MVAIGELYTLISKGKEMFVKCTQSELSCPMKTKKYVQTIFLDIRKQFENPAFAVWGLIVFYHAHLC